MNKKEESLSALKKAKEAVDQANKALTIAIQELDRDALSKVTGGGEFDDVPTVQKHPYKPDDQDRY